MSTKEQYPANEGWLTMELTLNSKKPLGEDQIKKLVTFGHTDSYEFGPIEQYGNKVKAILRSKLKV